jgi:hypothetical protein
MIPPIPHAFEFVFASGFVVILLHNQPDNQAHIIFSFTNNGIDNLYTVKPARFLWLDLHTVKPVLRGHIWDKDKVTL